MVLLLGSRGRGRGGRSAGQALGRVMRWVFGGSSSSRAASVSGLTALVLAMLCFVGGYVVGNHLAVRGDGPGKQQALKAPGLIGEPDTNPLSTTSLLVAAYEQLSPEQAKPKAKALAEYLRGRGFAKAKPYEFVSTTGSLWLVLVYYGTEAERRDTAGKLQALPPDVPDEFLTRLRERKWDDGKVWPITYLLQ